MSYETLLAMELDYEAFGDNMIFRAANGNWFTKQLFFETTLSNKENVVYTLKYVDHLGYPSLYRLYMEASDPTEYQFAITHLGGWPHWEELLENNWFKPYIAGWRRELEVKLKSMALANLIIQSTSPDPKTSVPVNRYLLDKDWTPEAKAKRRPNKAAIREAANDLVLNQDRIKTDFENLGKFNA